MKQNQHWKRLKQRGLKRAPRLQLAAFADKLKAEEKKEDLLTVIPMIRRMIPGLIAAEILSVQPMGNTNL